MGKNKTRRINLRLTEEEYQMLEKRRSSALNSHISDYLRTVIFHRSVTIISRNRSMDEFMQELIKLRTELKAIGNNFNQVTRKINSSHHQQALAYWLQTAIDLQQDMVNKTQVIQQRINEFSDEWLRKLK